MLSQRSSERRWTIYRLGDYDWHLGTPTPATASHPALEFFEVMPVAEMQEAAADVIRKSIGSEVIRQIEEECSYYREAAAELVEAWEAGELSECGSTFRRLKKMLAEEPR